MWSLTFYVEKGGSSTVSVGCSTWNRYRTLKTSFAFHYYYDFTERNRYRKRERYFIAVYLLKCFKKNSNGHRPSIWSIQIAKVSMYHHHSPLHDEEKQVIKVNQSLFTLFLLLVKWLSGRITFFFLMCAASVIHCIKVKLVFGLDLLY